MRKPQMKDKGVCLVTGGASGIGFAAARELVQGGWRVALLDVDGGKLAGAGKELGRACVGISADVTDAKAVGNAIVKIETDLGPLTGVVNSAGVAKDIPCLETDPEL